ncbi:hypothetical protein HYH03_000447 [Edaphochlamys debaryana]|uniref:U-box domain-containing protein n=1 Tax=Edaphochlamys debaryana TaxID=47281 RepID=A0A835YQE1_9CHLO|nr:hypothetical protein HYH03_000447 [Edaphochlamys debaryana]|eukprot:KAG2501949.1 hypothetical protein HYH03_000447 [Edaphochlamys debaryana]
MLALLLQLYEENDLPADGLVDVLNLTNKRGQSCLHVAAAAGNSSAVGWLLSHGCELLRVDKAGRTPMHWAAAAGSEACGQLLLAAAEQEEARAAERASPTSPSTPGRPGTSSGLSPAASLAAAAVAAAPADPAAVSKLVSGADSNGLTPMHFAAAANALGLARLLLGAGASYTAQCGTDVFEASMPCNAGWTCLHVAAMRGNYDLALEVLRHHSSLPPEVQLAEWRPNRSTRTSDPRAITDRRGTTAAALAASRGYPDLGTVLHPDNALAACVSGSVGTLGPDGQEVKPPAMFTCPITQEVLRDPVVASDGFTYERAAIAKWIATGKLTSPMTNLPFTSRQLYPNNVIMSAIKEWRLEHRLSDPRQPSAKRRAGSGVVVDVNNAVGGAEGAARDPFISHLRSHGM